MWSMPTWHRAAENKADEIEFGRGQSRTKRNMKIKNARIEGLVNGLRALDGVNSGTPQFKPYRFPPAR